MRNGHGFAGGDEVGPNQGARVAPVEDHEALVEDVVVVEVVVLESRCDPCLGELGAGVGVGGCPQA